MRLTRGFHPRRRARVTEPGRLARAGICRVGEGWDDLRFSDAAEREVDNWGPGVVELFLQQHWRSLPRVLRDSYQSVFRAYGRAVVVATTFCERGRVLGLVQTAREAGVR